MGSLHGFYLTVLRKSFYIHWSAGRSPRFHEVNPGRDPSFKHLTCTISYSSGLQNIYKLHTWKCSKFTIFALLPKETKIHIH